MGARKKIEVVAEPAAQLVGTSVVCGVPLLGMMTDALCPVCHAVVGQRWVVAGVNEEGAPRFCKKCYRVGLKTKEAVSV